MASYNVQMNMLNESGTYDVIWPEVSKDHLIVETGTRTGTGEIPAINVYIDLFTVTKVDKIVAFIYGDRFSFVNPYPSYKVKNSNSYYNELANNNRTFTYSISSFYDWHSTFFFFSKDNTIAQVSFVFSQHTLKMTGIIDISTPWNYAYFNETGETYEWIVIGYLE